MKATRVIDKNNFLIGKCELYSLTKLKSRKRSQVSLAELVSHPVEHETIFC